MTTQTSNMTDKARQAQEETRQSAQKMADQTKQAWQDVQEHPTPSGLMGAMENLPATFYLYSTLGSIGLSLLLRIAGRKEFANFVGLWPPTILSLALLNKVFRPSSEMKG